jgi:hypothetical protein
MKIGTTMIVGRTLVDQAGYALIEGGPHQFQEAGLHQGFRVARLDRIADAVERLRPFGIARPVAVEQDGFHCLISW